MSDNPTPVYRGFVGRRVAGVVIDWVLSLVISAAFFPDPSVDVESLAAVERVFVAGHPMATLAIFALQHLILVATLGTTIGHRLVGVRVVRDDHAPYVGVIKAALRTFLLLLVIPAVVWDGESRGFHDVAAGTRVISTRTAPSA